MTKKFIMNFKSENLPQPAELRSQGQPPLLKQLELMFILFLSAFIVAFAFGMFFFFSDMH
jgi:hypothetical protein